MSTSKRLPIVIASAALALGFAGQAVAAEQFQGFYLGLGAGYGSNSYESTRSDIGSTDLGNGNLDGRVYAGYGHMMRRLFAGIEVDFGGSSGKTENTSLLAAGGVSQPVQNEFKRDYNYGLDLMLGYLVAERVMLYGKVGYEQANFKYDSTVLPAAGLGGGGTTSGGKTMGGIRLGGGIGVGLTDSLTARLEYRGTFYGDDLTIDYSNGTTNIVQRIEPVTHTFMVNLQYQF